MLSVIQRMVLTYFVVIKELILFSRMGIQSFLGAAKKRNKSWGHPFSDSKVGG